VLARRTARGKLDALLAMLRDVNLEIIDVEEDTSFSTATPPGRRLD
jgi:hypothetical protein